MERRERGYELERTVFVSKVVRFFHHAASSNLCSSARTSLGGLSHTPLCQDSCPVS